MNDRLLQAPHIEQPAGHTRVQAIVDPTAFHPVDKVCSDCDCLVPPGALVFRELNPKRTAQSGMASKKARRQGFASRVIANVGVPPTRSDDDAVPDLKFLGVAIDGVIDTRAAHMNPDVSGRFTVAMSGTVTVMLTDMCLKDCRVGDPVQISLRCEKPHSYHKVPRDFQIPVLQRAGNHMSSENYARDFFQQLFLVEGLPEEHVSNWRRVVYDEDYATEHDLRQYLMGAPQPLPDSDLWLYDIMNVIVGEGTKAPVYSKAPVPPYSDDSWSKSAAIIPAFIEASKSEPADRAYRIAMGISQLGGALTNEVTQNRVGTGLRDALGKLYSTKRNDSDFVPTLPHDKIIGTLLEKGDGYARIKLLPMHDVNIP